MMFTGARMFCLDDVSGGAGVLEHMTPGVVGVIVGAADGAAHLSARPGRRVWPRAPVAAGHAPRCARVQFTQARLALLALDAAARRRFCNTNKPIPSSSVIIY